jgi:GDP-4-dehydro-6-deoxy-D-mannose reductase
MRILITGIGGFIGWHLTEFLRSNGLEVAGIQRSIAGTRSRTTKTYQCDIVHEVDLKRILLKLSPSLIFHLAAQSLPSVSWQDPKRTIQVNLIGALNLLKCVETLHLDTRIIFFGSSSEYAPSTKPISEDYPLRPSSPYALSKIASSLLAGLYHDAFETDIVIVRPFFIIGPRKTGDVCSSFARGIAQVERGETEALGVGNLNAVRDFLDVKDAIQAIWSVSRKGRPGEIYNISSGVGTPVSEILEILKSKARTNIPIEADRPRPRALDNPVVIGNNQKLKRLGWKPTIMLEESLSKILDYWRNAT